MVRFVRNHVVKMIATMNLSSQAIVPDAHHTSVLRAGFLMEAPNFGRWAVSGDDHGADLSGKRA